MKISHPEVIDGLCEYISKYNAPIAVACQCAGISVATWYKAKRRGREAQDAMKHGEKVEEEELPYLEFITRIDQALAEGQIDALKKIREAGKDPKHWKAMAWILERRFPNEYGARQELTIGAKPPVPITEDISEETAELFYGALSAFADDRAGQRRAIDAGRISDN